MADLRDFPEPSLTIERCNLCGPSIVRVVPARSTTLLAACAGATALALGALAGPGAARTPGCASLKSQAAAQELFVGLGGRPGHDVGGLDPDGDGVACEERPAPYEGFATIGYNRAKGFFYGVATMPRPGSGEAGFACLAGNRHFPEGPRLLRIHRVTREGDRPVSGDIGTAAQAGSGRLLWKLDRGVVPRGRYYASFEEQQPLGPYEPSECPGFRSRTTVLPRPPR